MLTDKLINIRALAILIVVLGHSIILYDPHWILYSPAKEFNLFMFLKYIINLIQMPLFFSISGYLYFWTVNKKTFKAIIRNKVFRILIPFIFILLLYTNPLKHYLEVPGYESLNILLFQNLKFNELGHMWFLPVLFVLFLINYIPFRWNSPKLSIFFIFVLIILAYMSYFLPSSFLIRSIASNWVFFYVGGIMNRFKILEQYDKKNTYLYLTIFVLLIILGIILPFQFTIPISLLLIPLTYLIIPNTTSDSIEFLASLSFGIYLFHSPLIYITFTYFLDNTPWIIFLLNFVVFGLVAGLITFFIKKTRLKFLIGE